MSGYTELEMGHGHGHHVHGDAAEVASSASSTMPGGQAQRSFANRSALEANPTPPCLSGSVLCGAAGGVLLWVLAAFACPEAFAGNALVPVCCLACGVALGSACVGSSSHACAPLSKLPLLCAAAASGSLVVTVFVNLGGGGYGGGSLAGAVVFALVASCAATFSTSCALHRAWWNKVLFESSIDGQHEQTVAYYLWHKQMVEKLLRMGVLSNRNGAPSHDPAQKCCDDHGGQHHGHSHGHH